LIDKIRGTSIILDESVPKIDAPVLQPQKYVKPRVERNLDEAKRRKEIREIEEMLGLRIRKIKITDPEEEERERKINKIKEINKKTPRFKITQTDSALNGTRDNSELKVLKVSDRENSCNEPERKS
jgi:hypothetical protein